MQVKTEINAVYPEIEIHVCNHEMNGQVRAVAAQIAGAVNDTITGMDESGCHMLHMSEIVRFYAQKQKVYAQDRRGCYSVRYKLYELEEQLDKTQFVRVSKSEIVNLKKIRQLDMNLAGTIKIILSDGTETYTSRRNIPRLKKALGLRA